MEAACNGIDGGVVLAFQGGNFGSAGKVDHNVRFKRSQTGSLCILCTVGVASSKVAMLEAATCMVLSTMTCRVCASAPAFPAMKCFGRFQASIGPSQMAACCSCGSQSLSIIHEPLD